MNSKSSFFLTGALVATVIFVLGLRAYSAFLFAEGRENSPDLSALEVVDQPVPVARNGLFRSAAQADILALRARFSHFEGLFGLSHPRNYSDYSRLARIIGAAQRQGHEVVACVLDREREQGKQKEK